MPEAYKSILVQNAFAQCQKSGRPMRFNYILVLRIQAQKSLTKKEKQEIFNYMRNVCKHGFKAFYIQMKTLPKGYF